MHFVARIVVEKVDHVRSNSAITTGRTKAMIANIAVSATDLDSLKEKAAAHLNLIEDGGEIDQRVTRGD